MTKGAPRPLGLSYGKNLGFILTLQGLAIIFLAECFFSSSFLGTGRTGQRPFHRYLPTASFDSSLAGYATNGSELVANGPPQSLFEPSIAVGQGGKLVAATEMTQHTGVVTTWVQRKGTTGWAPSGTLLPPGYKASYDSATTALPKGGFAVAAVATTSPQGPCLPNGSIFIATTSASQTSFTQVSMVNAQTSTSGFDDRPYIAAGPGGSIYIAWSHGPASDQCQIIGRQDSIMLSVSHDRGRSFSDPYTIPQPAGSYSFGVRIVPLGDGKAALSWSQFNPSGQVSIKLCYANALGSCSTPITVAESTAIPRLLPDATFYAFSLVGMCSFDHSRLLAFDWPAWTDGQAAMELAIGQVGGDAFSTATITPPPGSDYLFPAIASAGSSSLRLFYAVHQRTGNALGYIGQTATFDARQSSIRLSPPEAVIPSIPANYFELGEFMFIAKGRNHLFGVAASSGPISDNLVVIAWPTYPRTASRSSIPPKSNRPTPVSGVPPRSSALNLPTAVWLLLAVVLLVLVEAVIWTRARQRRRKKRLKVKGRGNLL